MRKVTYKFHFLSTYEDGNFGLDIIAAIVSKELPEQNPGLVQNIEIPKDFLTSAIEEDEDAAEFFSTYYNTVKSQRYKCMNKVCKITELNVEQEDERFCEMEWFEVPEMMKMESGMEAIAETESNTCKQEEDFFSLEDYPC